MSPAQGKGGSCIDLGEEFFKQKEQQVQRPQGRDMLGVSEGPKEICEPEVETKVFQEGRGPMCRVLQATKESLGIVFISVRKLQERAHGERRWVMAQ